MSIADAIRDLEALISDHRFLAADPEHNRIVIMLDVFDLLEMAFPYSLPYQNNRDAFFEPTTQFNILRGQINRSCLLFGLPTGRRTGADIPAPKDYYPIIVPPFYGPELIRYIQSPSVIQLNLDLRANLEAQTRSAQSGFAIAPDLLQTMLDKSKDSPIEALFQAAPDLVLVVSRLFPHSLDVLRSVFANGIVTTEFSGSPLSRLHPDIIGSKGEVLGFDPDQDDEIYDLESRVIRIAGRMHRTWRADLQSIRLCRYLNSILNSRGTLVIYVSSAPMINKVFRQAENSDAVSCEILGGYWEGVDGATFLRGIESFGYYVQFKDDEDRFDRLPTDPESIIKRAEAKLQELKSTSGQRVWQTDQVGSRLISIVNTAIAAVMGDPDSVSDDKSETVDEAIESTPASAAGRIDRNRFSRQGLSLWLGMFNRTLMDFKALSNAYSEQAVVNQLIAKELLVSLASTMSYDRRSVRSLVRTLLADLALFPFRVRFETQSINDLVGRIRRFIIAHPLDQADRITGPQLENFQGLLLTMASRSYSRSNPSDSFWGMEISSDAVDSEFKFERQLVWLVLLTAYQWHATVYPMAHELASEAPEALKSEFRVISIQAEIMFMRKKRREERRTSPRSVREIIDRCIAWTNNDPHPDARLLFLAAFAWGTHARAFQEGKLSWDSDYDKAWAIRMCEKSLLALSIRDSSDLDRLKEQSWNDWHLAITVGNNLAYFKCINERNPDTIMESLDLIRTYSSDEALLTSMCLHNRAFVYNQAMLFVSQDTNDFERLYDCARSNYLLSNGRRKDPIDHFDVIFDETAPGLAQWKQHSRLVRDAIGCRLAYLKGFSATTSS